MTRKGEGLITFMNTGRSLMPHQTLKSAEIYYMKNCIMINVTEKTILLQIKLWLRVRNLNKILIDCELQKHAYKIQFGF